MSHPSMSAAVTTAAIALTALTTPAHAGYRGGPVTNGGTIAGTVTFGGKVPPRATIRVTKNPEVCGTSKPSEDLLVGAGGALRNAVVYLDGIDHGKPAEKTVVHLGQHGCVYVPHVQATTKGSKVALKSADPIMHNVHGTMTTGRMIFNVGMPGTGTVIRKKLRKTGIAVITCDAGHTWMKAYIHVFAHPYFAVTGADGRFTLPDVPPGTYDLVVWHEKLGTKKTRVTVTAGATATASFALR